MVGERRGGVIVGSFFYWGQLHVVFPVTNWIEESALILEQIGAVKAILDRHAVDVPFSGVVGPVAGAFQHFG